MGELGVNGFPVTVCVVLSDVKQRCVKFTVAAAICLLVLLLLAGILLAYYCECRIYPRLFTLITHMLLQPLCELNLEYPHTHTHRVRFSVVFSSSRPTVSSPCVHGMKCGDGSCVWESQWCDGATDCPAGQDEANCGKQPHPGGHSAG